MRLWNLASTRLVFQISGITYVAAPYGEVTPEVADNVVASSGLVQGTLAYLFTGQQSNESIVEPITEDAEEPFEPDGILLVKYHRIGNDSGPDNEDDVFLLTADVHYLADRLVTSERQPPFAR